MRRRNLPELTPEQIELRERARAIPVPFEKIERPLEYQVAAKEFNDSLTREQKTHMLIVNYVNGKAVS